MKYKIMSIDIDPGTNYQTVNSNNSIVNSRINLYTSVSLELLITDYTPNEMSSLENFENALSENSYKTKTKTFNEQEIKEALQEKYPEHFI